MSQWKCERKVPAAPVFFVIVFFFYRFLFLNFICKAGVAAV